MTDDSWVPPAVMIAVDLVILTLRDPGLHVLLVERGVPPYKAALALPGGFLRHSEEDLTAADGLIELGRVLRTGINELLDEGEVTRVCFNGMVIK